MNNSHFTPETIQEIRDVLQTRCFSNIDFIEWLMIERQKSLVRQIKSDMSRSTDKIQYISRLSRSRHELINMLFRKHERLIGTTIKLEEKLDSLSEEATTDVIELVLKDFEIREAINTIFEKENPI